VRTLFDRWWAVREMHAIDRQYSDDYKVAAAAEIVSAAETYECGDRELALTMWNNTCRRFPNQCMASEPGLFLLLKLGCFDEIDAMMEAGRKRYPREEHYARGYAQSAHQRGNLQEALRRCETVRRKFPQVAEGYSIAAACLTDLGRHGEAETMIARGVLKLPNKVDLHVQHARNATQRREWPEALRRWQVVRSRFGQQFVGPLGEAQCLREMCRFSEAEKILTEACERFYQIDWVYAEWADLATAKGDFDEAVQRWEALLRRSPTFALAYTKGAEAMRKIGRETAADELLGVAVTRIRTDLSAHLEYARSAHRRGDWIAATERWALARNRFPENAEAREREIEASLAAAEQ
jgi:tetratricopeptide (TPR) repeat protein